MGAINLASVMDAIANTITEAGVTDRAYAWPVESVSPPCVVVGYPKELDFDVTFTRGSDRALFPVYVIVGKVSDRSARDVLSNVITGATGIKDALDGDLGGEVSTARVQDCQIEDVNVAGVAYLAAVFTLEVYT